jgi:hypothetical protein
MDIFILAQLPVAPPLATPTFKSGILPDDVSPPFPFRCLPLEIVV